MKLKHFTSCDHLDLKDLLTFFRCTNAIREHPKSVASALRGRVLATLFYEPSTRTRLSFESAILHLGGTVIGTENASEMSSAIKGETLLDTIRVVSGYADAIILRHPDNNSSVAAAMVATVPIINAGSGAGEHPTQALLDLYTIYTKNPALSNLKVLFCGDLRFGRTVHSLAKLLCKCDKTTIYGLASEALQLPQSYISHLESHGSKYIPISSFQEAPRKTSVIYQTRVQSERFENDLKVEEYLLNKEVMAHFSDQTMIMHPLPRKKELSTDLDQDARAVYFEQTRNGLFIRMALLQDILT